MGINVIKGFSHLQAAHQGGAAWRAAHQTGEEDMTMDRVMIEVL